MLQKLEKTTFVYEELQAIVKSEVKKNEELV